MVHVPRAARPDVLNVADPFLALTDVTVASAAFPGFDRSAPVLAVQRKVAEMLVVTDDAGPGSALEDSFPRRSRAAGSRPRSSPSRLGPATGSPRWRTGCILDGPMARAMWRGAIQFGLVTIPVKLYLATESSGIGFNMLHASCLNRIQMKIYCPFHDEVVPRSETVRGYEWSKGRYVVVTDEDLEAVPLKTVRSIEIAMFVDAEKEDHGAAVREERLLPRARSGRQEGLLPPPPGPGRTSKSAICKVVMKDREQLAAINPYSESMLLTTLHWPDEIRPIEELAVDSSGIEIKASERKMAEQLIASMTAEFSAEEFRDDYRQALMGVIEAKVAGEEPTPIAATEPTKIGDLMAALEAAWPPPARRAGTRRRGPTRRRSPSRRPPGGAGRRNRPRLRRPPDPAAQDRLSGGVPPEQLPASRRAGGRDARLRLPDRIAPMQPAEADAPFDDPDYLFEPWWPGCPGDRLRRAWAGAAPGGRAGGCGRRLPRAVELPAQLAEDGVAVDGTAPRPRPRGTT